jgi:hypothetical protein
VIQAHTHARQDDHDNNKNLRVLNWTRGESAAKEALGVVLVADHPMSMLIVVCVDLFSVPSHSSHSPVDVALARCDGSVGRRTSMWGTNILESTSHPLAQLIVAKFLQFFSSHPTLTI